MDAIRALSEEIGPRPACSRAEVRAAEWCAARLAEQGYVVEVEPFRSRRDYKGSFAVYFALALVGALLVVPAPLIASALGAIALVLYARDAEGRPLIRPRVAESRNVVARPPGSGAPELVVMAHMDSARASVSFHPRLVGGLRSSILLLHGALFLVPLGAGVAWIAEAGEDLPAALWIPSGVVAAYLLGALALQVHALRYLPVVAGANDNASGVEVLMRVAADRPPDTWFVVTGSKEAGMLGAQAFLDAHAGEVAAARVLNLDNCGAGRVVAAEEEGILRAHRADAVMLRAAEGAGARSHDHRTLPTDATVLLARKHRALTVLAVDDDGLLPNRHWPTDVASNIVEATLAHATTVARAVVAAVTRTGVGE